MIYEDKCEECGKRIGSKVASYSFHAFGRSLCFEHQRLERIKTMPAGMADLLSKNL
jgi:hypothetical protein